MKKMALYGMADTAVAENTNTQFPNVPHQESPTITHLQDPFSAQTELKRALVARQQQLKAAQQQIQTLAETNAFLRQRLIRLAKKCAEARHFAHHDELTGLPNRSLLMDRLRQAMAQSARQQKQVALLFIDLDRFKSINDRLGHAAGDKLLQLVAERLAACIRYGDTACRYGGDEFVILLPEINGQESAAVVTEKIRAHLAASYVVDGYVIAITASIGVAVYRTGGQKGSDLIKQADKAMYQAKMNSVLPNRSL
ncbi:GGDEF domain-containing protein [Methylomicrobium sp. Wu6]|uniref:GGDEF domain-containing protein n=1 Tax=Methylomicrobium sp. Wu6 TaxID=3107928 RepID=UPI002DD68972|nr:GGDEF domain-containing protein [Methylomicrobium sp. Wu6]MEC4747037.1 GGDEF domain-containing protein [Methylomicrobium sp. Wu6]